jgi:hypothetical protein
VVLGNLIAVVGGIICAMAQSVNVVIVGMAVAGIGSQLLLDKSPSLFAPANNSRDCRSTFHYGRYI